MLVEDFPENDAADASSKLLPLLRLPGRGLARTEIENTLMRFGAQILADQLHLDPLEYRLVCIPYDLYMRYRVVISGTVGTTGLIWLLGLRQQPDALVGGNAGFGGVDNSSASAERCSRRCLCHN